MFQTFDKNTSGNKDGIKNNSGHFFGPLIQPKLTINQPGDVYEQEADAVADKVMLMKDLHRQLFFNPVSQVQKKCTGCEEEEKKEQVQRKLQNIFVQRQSPPASAIPAPAPTPAPVATPGPSAPPTAAPSPAAPTPTAASPTLQPAREGSGGDALGAVMAIPQVSRLVTEQKQRLLRDLSEAWTDSSLFGKFFAGAVALGLGSGLAMAIYLSRNNPSALDFFVSPVSGTIFQLPAIGGLPAWTTAAGLELNFDRPDSRFPVRNEMVGVHFDVGRFLPGVLGFGPVNSFTPIGAPPSLSRKNEGAENAVIPNSQALEQSENYIISLNGKGKNLSESEKSFFEPRIGYDFSTVKIHADTQANESAKTLNALAYTQGNNIVFGSNQYQPETTEGKRLLAHELTHVVQQKNTSRKIQRTPVTSGEYGAELDHYTTMFSVPATVITLLRRSSTYMTMARSLDTHYVALDGAHIPSGWAFDWNPNTDGVLSHGPFRGRRVLAIWYGASGSEFLPSGSLDNNYGYDIILLQPPQHFSGDQAVGEWIQIIAHETTHAFTRNTSGSVAPATVADRITAAITDEANTRGTESAIATEATRGNRLPDYTPSTGSTNPAQVQRDMFPSSLKRTYLEEFVFDELVRQAISNEGLSQSDIEQHNTRIDALTVEDIDGVVASPGFILYFDAAIHMYNTFTSKYDELRYIQRVINARWTRYQQSNAGDLDVKETILQEHAQAFFNGIISYRARP